VHYRVHTSPPMDPILSHLNPVRPIDPCLPKAHLNVIFPPTPRSSQWSLAFGPGRAKESVQVRGALKHFVTKKIYGESLSAPRPAPKLEDHTLSAVRNCSFNIFAATFRTRRTSLHPQPENAPCRDDKGPS
jgi:hypothetical protein